MATAGVASWLEAEGKGLLRDNRPCYCKFQCFSKTLPACVCEPQRLAALLSIYLEPQPAVPLWLEAVNIKLNLLQPVWYSGLQVWWQGSPKSLYLSSCSSPVEIISKPRDTVWMHCGLLPACLLFLKVFHFHFAAAILKSYQYGIPQL